MPGRPPPGIVGIEGPPIKRLKLFRNVAAALAAFLFLAMLVLQAQAQAMPEHGGHQWLQNKYNSAGQNCCSGGQSGDCQPVPFDSYSEDPKGGVNYGNYYFPPGSVLPTEDPQGRPHMCIFNGQARCAFVPRGV